MTDKKRGSTIDPHNPPSPAGSAVAPVIEPRLSPLLLKLSWLVLMAVSLAVLGVFFALGQYAYPSADDFCMAAGARDYGLLEYLWQHYFDWSGRYTGNALYGLYPTVFGLFGGYPWLAGLLIVALIMSMAFLLATLFRLSLTHPSVWGVSLVFACVYLLGLRHTASSLYWLAGAMTYQSAHILLLLTLAVILRILDRQRHQGRAGWLAVALLLLIVLGVGTNEINMIVVTLLMALIYLYHRWFRPQLRAVWWLLLLVTLACFAVVYFSPGNSMREASFPLRHDWARSIEGSLRMGGWTLMVWTGNPVFMVGSLLTPFAALRLRQASSRDLQISNSVLLMLAALTLGMPLLLQFPAWWAMGGWPPPRTVDAIFFIFLLSWLGLVAALALRFLPANVVYRDHEQMTSKATAVLLLLSLLFIVAVSINSKFQRALGDLFERGPTFSQYMMQRHALIEQAIADGRYSLQAPAYDGEVPRSIYFNDIRANWRDWRNVCYARYFGLRAIQRDRGGDMERGADKMQDAPF